MATPATVERRPAPQPAAGDPGPYQGAPSSAQYLLSKGWKCLGNPDWPGALWLDPTKPLAGTYGEEPCLYDVEVRDEQVVDGKIKVTYRKEQRQVMVPDSRGGGGQVSARRTVYHPPVTPLSLAAASLVQMQRDAQEAVKAALPERKTA